MGLEVETVKEAERRKAGRRLRARPRRRRPDGDDWEEWLQTHRIELNAMTTPQFIAWLDGKMAEHYGKLIPPPDVLDSRAGGTHREQGPRRHHRAHPARGRAGRSGRRRHRGDQNADCRHPCQGHRGRCSSRARAGVARPHRVRGRRDAAAGLIPPSASPGIELAGDWTRRPGARSALGPDQIPKMPDWARSGRSERWSASIAARRRRAVARGGLGLDLSGRGLWARAGAGAIAPAGSYGLGARDQPPQCQA